MRLTKYQVQALVDKIKINQEEKYKVYQEEERKKIMDKNEEYIYDFYQALHFLKNAHNKLRDECAFSESGLFDVIRMHISKDNKREEIHKRLIDSIIVEYQRKTRAEIEREIHIMSIDAPDVAHITEHFNQ